nr:hypothetical protein [Tanacetum cinerariifolium]
MALTFADTHNMIAYLTKSDASEGFDQIINFLNASAIKYALTVNLNIYVSCIKLFWSSVSVKKQWKFLIHTILQCMSVKRTSWNEFSSSMALAFICLSTEKPLFEGMIVAQQADDVTDEVAAGVDVDDVPAADAEPTLPSPTPTTQPPPLPQELPSTSQVTLTSPLSRIAQPSSPLQQQPTHDAEISLDLLHTLLETYTTLTRRIEHLEQDKIAQALEITKLKQRGEIIANIDADEDATLKDVADDKVKENADVQGRPEDSQAQIYKIDVEHADKVLSIQDDESEPAELKEVVEVVTTAKLMTEVVIVAAATITAATTPISATTITAAPSATRRRKGVVIRDPEETATPSTIIHFEPKSKDKGKGIMMDYFKGISYDDIHPIFKKYFNSNVAFLEKTKEHLEEEKSRALKRQSESLEEKAAKKQKLDEELLLSVQIVSVVQIVKTASIGVTAV